MSGFLIGAGGGGGVATHVNQYSASNGATLDVEGFSTSYDWFYLVVRNMYVHTAAANLYGRLKVGGSYLASALDYSGGRAQLDTGSLSGAGSGSTAIVLATVCPDAGDDGLGGRLDFPHAADATMWQNVLWCLGGGEAASGGSYWSAGNARVSESGAGAVGLLQGFRFVASSGNISGVVDLFGVTAA